MKSEISPYKANPKFDYSGNHIVKIWEQYLKNVNSDIKFLIYDIEGTLKDKESIFIDLSQQNEVALVLNSDSSLYKNSSHQSITLCGEIDHDGKYIANIESALDQIKKYNQDNKLKVNDHIIIFPYHVTSHHWNLGAISLNVSNGKEFNNVTLSVYEPFGGSTTSQTLLNYISGNTQLKDISPVEGEKHIKQQNDNSACGAITAENGKDFLSNKVLEHSQIYMEGAKNLREAHMKEIDSQAFNKEQHENKNYIVKGDLDIKEKDSIEEFVDESANLITNLVKKMKKQDNLVNTETLDNKITQDRFSEVTNTSPIDYLDQINKNSTKKYSVTKTVQMGHPNKEGFLDNVINKVLDNKEVKTLKEFHNKVYESLNNEIKYEFTTYEKSSSDNLLFYLVINNNFNQLKQIIEKYDFDLATVQDSSHNNIIHIASYCGHHGIIKEIFKKYKNSEEFTKLLNHRNDEGTNPLGMVFLKKEAEKIANENLNGVVKLFIFEQNFRINDYLNNKQGMDYSSSDFLKKIGGFNILHMTLTSDFINNNTEVLGFLFQRNFEIGWNNSDNCCNFFYPSLNPKFHIYSPEKLATNTMTHSPQKKETLLKYIKFYQKKQEFSEDRDSSGDSSDEESPAYFYKEELIKLSKMTSNNSKTDISSLNAPYEKGTNVNEGLKKLHDNIVIPHFHGVPFMKGQYTNHQRREVAKKLFECINRKTNNKADGDGSEKGDHNSIENIIGELHSRTSTATHSIETLYHLVIAPEETLESLHNTDEVLSKYLSSCYTKNKELFLEVIKDYVYNFSNNPIEDVWKRLERIEKPPEDIIKYRFPFLSLSKAPDHAVKFAIGHNVETQSLDEQPMSPKYNNDGAPKHRLAGLLLVTMHSLKEINFMEHHNQIADITKLLKTNELTTYSKLADKRINYQIECTFFGGIKSSDVVAVIPIIYPNFSKNFSLGYHDTVYGLLNPITVSPGRQAANSYKKAKDHFIKTQPFPSCYDSNNQNNITIAGKVLMPAFVNLALKLSHSIAGNDQKILCYYSCDGHLKLYSTKYTKEGNTHYSDVQLSIKKELPQNLSETVDKKDLIANLVTYPDDNVQNVGTIEENNSQDDVFG